MQDNWDEKLIYSYAMLEFWLVNKLSAFVGAVPYCQSQENEWVVGENKYSTPLVIHCFSKIWLRARI